jgi:hypothetical protein
MADGKPIGSLNENLNDLLISQENLERLRPDAWLAAVAARATAQLPASARPEMARLAEALKDVSEMQQPQFDAGLPIFLPAAMPSCMARGRLL